MTQPLARAVLAGGRSTRMGRDKMLVEVDGVPMGRRVAHALGLGCADPVFMIGGSATTAEMFGLGHIPDRIPGQGPVMGVLSALEALETDVIVAACDLPCLDQSTVALFASGDAAQFDVAVAVSEGRRQPSLARWNHRGLEALQLLVEAGERSMHGVLNQLNVGEIACRADRLLNANRPEDLSASTASQMSGQ